MAVARDFTPGNSIAGDALGRRWLTWCDTVRLLRRKLHIALGEEDEGDENEKVHASDERDATVRHDLAGE